MACPLPLADAVRAVEPALCTGSNWLDDILFGMLDAQPDLVTVREWAALRGEPWTTVQSRFYRRGLPSAKSYLAAIRLLLAAHLLEQGRSITETAHLLHYSTPQSFARHLREVRGLTPTEWRGRSFADECAAFRQAFIDPYPTARAA